MSAEIGAGLKAKYPDGVAIEWTDATGRYLGVKLPGGERVVDTCFMHVPTAEEIAAVAALAARTAKAATIIQNARDNIALVKAGALTNNQRDMAIKELSRAVLYLAKGEVNE